MDVSRHNKLPVSGVFGHQVKLGRFHFYAMQFSIWTIVSRNLILWFDNAEDLFLWFVISRF